MHSISTKKTLGKLPHNYKTDPGYIQLQKYKNWCKVNVGQDNWNYYGEFQYTPFVFNFRHEADLLAFKLVFGL